MWSKRKQVVGKLVVVDDLSHLTHHGILTAELDKIDDTNLMCCLCMGVNGVVGAWIVAAYGRGVRRGRGGLSV